jgi:hypothetical protein
LNTGQLSSPRLFLNWVAVRRHIAASQPWATTKSNGGPAWRWHGWSGGSAGPAPEVRHHLSRIMTQDRIMVPGAKAAWRAGASITVPVCLNQRCHRDGRRRRLSPGLRLPVSSARRGSCCRPGPAGTGAQRGSESESVGQASGGRTRTQKRRQDSDSEARLDTEGKCDAVTVLVTRTDSDHTDSRPPLGRSPIRLSRPGITGPSWPVIQVIRFNGNSLMTQT